MGAAAPPANIWNKSCQIFAFNDLGMHCYDSDFSAFAILPPFNTIHAQVIYKDYKPKLLSNAAVKLYYSATYSTIYDQQGNPVDFWSRNTTSAGKINFWQYFSALFPSLPPPPPDEGILGAKMPSVANGPQPLNNFDSAYQWFSATGIPITNIDDRGKINCFPMMRIQAYDLYRRPLLSSLDIVVPVSSEFNCASCHATGMDAAPPSRLENPPSFSTRDDNDPLQFRENILILHDAMNQTTLMDDYRAGKPTLCASCHYSKALDLAGAGPQDPQKGHLYLSLAIHKHHGTIWPIMDQGLITSWVIPIPGSGVQTCYYCHPGNDTQCLRSVMAVQGMQCQNCHGGIKADGGFTDDNGLLALAGFSPAFADPSWWTSYPNPDIVKLTTTGAQRRPWMDLPKCQSCHSGDSLQHRDSDLIGRLAYDPADAAATPLIAVNQRFAENQNQLYRFSETHGGVACESCHGSPHAEWPARLNSNDNVTAMQIQGHTGEISECGACHKKGLPPNLKGPHGLHNVNDPAWMASHGVFMWQNPAACQACHGQDWRGTVLSRAKADRLLFSLANPKITLAKGTTISCYACHKVIPVKPLAR